MWVPTFASLEMNHVIFWTWWHPNGNMYAPKVLRTPEVAMSGSKIICILLVET